MFEEHQVVQTKECITRFYYKGVPAAMPAKSRGTVIHVWAPGVYEVEFPQYGMTPDGELDPNKEGRPIIETLHEDELEECKEAL